MPTDNHQYNTPAEGSTDWHLPLNENFSFLDEDIEIRDTLANQGNYTPKQGAKFLATDSGEVFLGDGAQWNFLGDIVPEQAGSGSAIGVSPLDFQPSPTDGILEAIRSSNGEPVRVEIPRGGGSGPNGEYQIQDTFNLADAYAGGYGTGQAGIKIDRDDVWLVSDGASLIPHPDAAAGTHLVFIAAFTDDHNPNNLSEAGTQVENVWLNGLILDGRGGDYLGYSTYESRHCGMKECISLGWATSGANSFDDIPIRSQHHGDATHYIRCLFIADEASSNIKALAKHDGSFSSSIRDCYFRIDPTASSITGRFFQLNDNNDFDRPAINNRIVGNTFDYTEKEANDVAAPVLGIQTGYANLVANNSFITDLDQHTFRGIVFSTRGAGAGSDVSRRGPSFLHNRFVGSYGIRTGSIDPSVIGARFIGNTGINSDGVTFYSLFQIGDGPFVDCTFRDNVYIHNTEQSGVANAGQFMSIDGDYFDGCTFDNNKTFAAENWVADGNAPASWPVNNVFRRNGSVGSPPSDSGAIKQANKGVATVPSGSTSVRVNHGISMTPLPQDLMDLSYVSAPSGAGLPYVDDITGTDFRLNVQSAPSADVNIAWAFDATPEWAT